MIRCPHCGQDVALQQVTPTLTKHQYAVYRFLWDFTQTHGYAPSFEEIADRFGYNSLATVHEHLGNLERKGFVHRVYNESRGITCLVPLTPSTEPAAAQS